MQIYYQNVLPYFKISNNFHPVYFCVDDLAVSIHQEAHWNNVEYFIVLLWKHAIQLSVLLACDSLSRHEKFTLNMNQYRKALIPPLYPIADYEHYSYDMTEVSVPFCQSIHEGHSIKLFYPWK